MVVWLVTVILGSIILLCLATFVLKQLYENWPWYALPPKSFEILKYIV